MNISFVFLARLFSLFFFKLHFVCQRHPTQLRSPSAGNYTFQKVLPGNRNLLKSNWKYSRGGTYTPRMVAISIRNLKMYFLLWETSLKYFGKARDTMEGESAKKEITIWIHKSPFSWPVSLFCDWLIGTGMMHLPCEKRAKFKGWLSFIGLYSSYRYNSLYDLYCMCIGLLYFHTLKIGQGISDLFGSAEARSTNYRLATLFNISP